MPRVLVIGLDGASWDLLDPLLAAGLMPNLASLVGSGSRTALVSTEPAETPVAWSTFQTGVVPELHGVYGFYNVHLSNGRVELVATSASTIRVKTLWEYVSQHGKRAAVIFCPMTFPPYPVNGVMMSGFPAPSSRRTHTYPSELWREIEQLGIDWVISEDPLPKAALASEMTTQEALQRLIGLVKGRVRIGLHLLNRTVWDLGFFQFQEIDWVQHAFWPRLLSGVGTGGTLPPSLRAFYQAVDDGVGELVKLVGSGDGVIAVSDHGFQECKMQVFPNRWLLQQGFLRAKRGVREPALGFARLLRHKLAPVDRFVGRIPRHIRVRLVHQVNLSGMDLRRSRAFVFCSGSPTAGLHFVNPGLPPHDRQEVLDMLAEFTDPHTGQRIVEAITPCPPEAAEGGPHYWARFSPGYSPAVRHGTGPVLRESIQGRPFRLGMHHPIGIFVGAGPVIRRGQRLASRARLEDVAPTILYLLGLDIPTYMQGRLLAEILEEEELKRRPPTRREDSGTRPHGSSPALSADEEAEIAARLRDLGYME